MSSLPSLCNFRILLFFTNDVIAHDFNHGKRFYFIILNLKNPVKACECIDSYWSIIEECWKRSSYGPTKKVQKSQNDFLSNEYNWVGSERKIACTAGVEWNVKIKDAFWKYLSITMSFVTLPLFVSSLNAIYQNMFTCLIWTTQSVPL